MKKTLVFPANSEIGLEIYRQLRFTKGIKLIGASSSVGAASYTYEIYDNNFPSVYDEKFIEYILNFCLSNKIELIIPAHDDVIYKLSQSKDYFNEIKILVPEFELAHTLRHKSLTYRKLHGIVKVPKLYNFKDLNNSNIYPIFIKEDAGQGSRGAYLAQDYSDALNNKLIEPIYCEYLPGAEVSIDCFSVNGKLLIAEERTRKSTTNGISNLTYSLLDTKLKEYCNEISKYLCMNNAWFAQFKEDIEGKWTLLEIAARIAGSSGLTHVKGFNLMEASIWNIEAPISRFLINDINVTMSRSLDIKCKIELQYNYVYVDLDDTLLINGQINHELIGFLYRSINLDKKIILITRHQSNLQHTLQVSRLNIFDEIIHITNNEPKSKYIKYLDSIFIDDSFRERHDVSVTIGIPVFSPSMVIFLKDA